MLNMETEKELTITRKSGKAFREDGWQLFQDVLRQRFRPGVEQTERGYE